MIRLPVDVPEVFAYKEARRSYKKTQEGQKIKWISTIGGEFED